MAPEAPIVGTVEVGSMATWVRRRDDPTDQVEGQERQPPEAVLDVVPEDPQEQHVPSDVDQAPCRNWLVTRVRASAERTPRPQGVDELGRHHAPSGHELRERRFATLSQEHTW